MKKLLIATKNPGKILEYREIFKELPFEILTLEDLNITDEPTEDGKTFEENAVKKANFYSRFAKLPFLAEDSGLEIDYLRGEPGVFSRRWPGHEAEDEELMQLALTKLKGAPRRKRGAQFRVVMVFKPAPESDVVISEGILRGYITEKPIAKIIPGYPFRSIFYVSEIGKVLGELTMAEEAKVAHRKEALKKLMPVIRETLREK